MPRLSAGLLVYRYHEKILQILLVHPGGPFYKKDIGEWSIPKGEYLEGEDALATAKKEFTEETGNILTQTIFTPLQPVKIKSGKVISAWMVEADFDLPYISSNLFEMEWPPRSGKMSLFPETDKAEWFTLSDARKKILTGQLSFLDQLEGMLEKKKHNQ